MFLYFYDLKGRGNEYNKIKRKFYYHLKKSKLSTLPLRTKSVIMVPDKMELTADLFFLRFKPYIEVYKARVLSIEDVF